MRIVTDSKTVEEPKDPNTCNVFALYSLFANEAEKAEMAAKYRAGGMGYGVAKTALLEKIDAYFADARAKRKELAAHPDRVEEILHEGARKARAEAQKTMDLVRSVTGLGSRKKG
jgi:tryptophanyl-tRNA synthetase